VTGSESPPAWGADRLSRSVTKRTLSALYLGEAREAPKSLGSIRGAI
jgi:hypothetical protein